MDNFTEDQIQCENCDCDIDIKNDTQGYDGNFYCEDCYVELFGECENCGNVFSVDDLTSVCGYSVCEDCIDVDYVTCDYCDDTIHQDNAIHYSEGILCEGCYQNEFFTCEGCEEIYPDSCYGGDGYCDSCHQENVDGVHSYSYKPKAIFYGDGDLFFGVELEIESEGNSISDAVESLPDFVYAKSDSSIDNGFEVVSHPTSWNWLQSNKKQWEKILDLRYSGFLSYRTDTCGMHVHMSKKAFSTLHLYKFLKMFFENQGFITIISRRQKHKLAEYASLQSDESIVYKAKKKGCVNRFTAVNLQNRDSVEVRIFRGTLSPTGFWRNLEFCKATYEFTKNTSIKDITMDKFCKYVVEQQKEYPNLMQFLQDKGLCPSLFNMENK